MSNTQTIKDPLIDLSPDFLKDPYSYYKKLREEEPVFWSEKGKYWLISRYDDVNMIIRDISFSKRFSQIQLPFLQSLISMDMVPLLSARNHWMLNQDPPDHTRMRSLVNKAFTPTMINQLRPHIEQIANQLIDKVIDRGEMELMAEFAFPLPVTVIAEMLGVPAEDQNQIKAWSTAITNAFDLGGRKDGLFSANKATGEFMKYLKPIVAERRKEPKTDLISILVQAEEEGNKLTEEELLANCVLLLMAGHETTVNLIGNGVLAFLTHGDQWKMVKDNPDLMPQAVDEILRYDSSVQFVRRIAVEDTEVRGKKIKKGNVIICLLGAANHDGEVFPDPDKFDITRKDSKYLSFGAGIHHCIGSTLAKTEAQIAFNTLFARLPNLALKNQQIEHKHHPTLRGLNKLSLSF